MAQKLGDFKVLNFEAMLALSMRGVGGQIGHHWLDIGFYKIRPHMETVLCNDERGKFSQKGELHKWHLFCLLYLWTDW